MKKKRTQGFTALELIVTMTVIAILLSTGVPAFKDYTWTQRMNAAMDTLLSDLKLARGKAIGLNTQTVMCPSANADDCSGQASWQDGWIIFADLNNDRHKQAGEPMIRQAEATDYLDISSPISRSYVRFYPNGSAPGSNATILFCDSRGAAHAGAVSVSNSGRIRSRTDGVQSSEICP